PHVPGDPTVDIVVVGVHGVDGGVIETLLGAPAVERNLARQGRRGDVPDVSVGNREPAEPVELGGNPGQDGQPNLASAAPQAPNPRAGGDAIVVERAVSRMLVPAIAPDVSIPRARRGWGWV